MEDHADLCERIAARRTHHGVGYRVCRVRSVTLVRLRCTPRPSPCQPQRVERGHEDGVIAQLTGRVDALEDGRCVIDVNGVGYLVHASTRTLAALPAPPDTARR